MMQFGRHKEKGKLLDSLEQIANKAEGLASKVRIMRRVFCCMILVPWEIAPSSS